MRTRAIVVLSLAIGLVMGSTKLLAHHGTGASYEMEKRVVLKGIATEFRFVNPHCQLYFDVKDDKGNVVHWSAEISSVFWLAKFGWNRNSIKPGDEVTVTLSPAKTGSPVGVMWEILLPNGRKMERDDGREEGLR